MNYKEFEIELEKINVENKEELNKFIEKIDINKDNFNEWVENLFNNEERKLNLDKLPYVIDILYQTSASYRHSELNTLPTRNDLLIFVPG